MTQETKANQGKGAIFDLDGTLLDSMGVWDQVDVDFLDQTRHRGAGRLHAEGRGHAIPPDRRIHNRTIRPVGHSRSVDGGVGPYGTCHVRHGG